MTKIFDTMGPSDIDIFKIQLYINKNNMLYIFKINRQPYSDLQTCVFRNAMAHSGPFSLCILTKNLYHLT